MNITEKQKAELTKHGWDIYENLYRIPLYSDEIGNFDELVEQLNVIPTEGDDGVKMFWILAISTKGDD